MKGEMTSARRESRQTAADLPILSVFQITENNQTESYLHSTQTFIMEFFQITENNQTEFFLHSTQTFIMEF